MTVSLSGPRKPSARSTRSQSRSNSLPAISFITGRPLSCTQSSRTPRSARTRPSPRNALVLIDQSRTTPSSCDDEVRRIMGQFGHESWGRSSGGWGSSSNWCTDVAPWRFDAPLLRLAVRNAGAEEPAAPVVALEEGREVTRPRELLGAGHACRTGADDRHRLPGSSRGDLGRHPAVAPGVIDDVLLDVLDRDRVVVDVEDARLLAGGGADAAGELREVVRRMQPGDRLPPAAPVHEVVPVGDDVAERAALVAEGDAAIHATRALAPQHLVGRALLELAPVLEALGDGLLVNLLALVLEEAGYLTHAPCPS